MDRRTFRQERSRAQHGLERRLRLCVSMLPHSTAIACWRPRTGI